MTQDAGGLAQKGGATWSYVLIADRQVTHLDVDDAGVERVVEAFREFFARQ